MTGCCSPTDARDSSILRDPLPEGHDSISGGCTMPRLPLPAPSALRARGGVTLAHAVAILTCVPLIATAQVPSRYTTGREILKLDFASTAIGDFPTGIKTLTGTMDVVDKGGM